MKTHQITKTIIVTVIAGILLSCNLTSAAQSPSTNGVEQTQIALGIESTMLAVQQQQSTLDAAADQAAANQAAADQAAVQAPPPTEQPTTPPVVVIVEQPTNPPPPEAPTDIPLPTDTAEPQIDIKDQIKGANILVYEDVRGNPNLTPYIQEVVNRMNFSGGKIVFVGDAVGNFMMQLNSAQKWDLIIVAAENRSWVRGEFWDVISEQINNNNAAVVTEIWTLDQIANGRISGFLYQCGISYQKNWTRPNNYDVLDYSMYWLDTSHPLLSSPNIVEPLYTATPYWIGDIGDLIRLGTGGDAQLVSGLYQREKSSYGTLATCMDGTVVVQTFSTHDYPRTKVMALWENYITYALTNHFKQMQQE